MSFDPARRPTPEPIGEQGTGLLRGLSFALLLTVLAGAWLFWFREYYQLQLAARVADPHHRLLRSSGGAGLAFGLASAGLILANLAYLLRRNPRWRFAWGSLQKWMTSHVATGILALLFALLHSAMATQDTVGGHALLGLVVLVITGAIGRYFYSFVPRAANGRELALHEVRTELATLSADWDRNNRDFGERVRVAIDGLVSSGHWRGTFFRRLWALLRSQSALHHTLARIRREGTQEGIPGDQLEALLGLARRAQRSALTASHYEDLRALMASWRYLHRWVALLMVLLVVVHIVTALRYAELGG